jgi:small subunit ribosomal protein S9
MAEDTPTNETPDEQPQEAPVEEQNEAVEAAAAGAVPVPDEDVAEAAEEAPAEPVAEAADDAPADGEPAAEEPAAEDAPEADAADDASDDEDDADDEPAAPRAKPAIPGADLEVDLVLEGEDRPDAYGYDEDGEPLEAPDESDVDDTEPVVATIDLAADARYKATGKRKTAVARVILRPGTGAYTVNDKPLDDFFPRVTLQRQIRQPLEAVGYDERMDVIARIHGGGVSSQAGALRHGISRALIDADPNLRGELKRRGFLTRDARVKERKKAGLKKARKRPQFSKR